MAAGPSRRAIRCGLSIWVALLSGAAGAAEPEPGEVKGAMRQIAAPLEVALPLALSEERFTDPANREALAMALAELAKSAAVLEQHGEKREASFEFLSRSLALDAAEVNRRFRAGRLEEARFLLRELANDCIECHSRLPSPGDSSLGASLFASVDAGDLDPFETIQLQLMTRQFQPALAGCEALLASPDQVPAVLDMEGVTSALLLLAVRIERQPERARTALDAFAVRPDTPLHLRETAGTWSGALFEIASRPDVGDLLERARRAAERGQAARRYPMDRNGAVWDLEASSLLYRFLERKDGEAIPVGQRAEAYYLLGLTELRRTEGFWPSEADFYLERAIRLAPGTDVALRAYAVLEEHTIIGYTGSAGLHLPPEIATWLEDLRNLAD